MMYKVKLATCFWNFVEHTAIAGCRDILVKRLFCFVFMAVLRGELHTCILSRPDCFILSYVPHLSVL